MKEWEYPSGEPATPWYDGPVRGINPTYGQGYADMFCPKCGSTGLESLEKYGRKYRCRQCGRVFKLDLHPEDKGMEYSVNYGGDPQYKRLSADDVGYCAFGTVMDREDAGRLSELASSYYGDAYDDLYSDEHMGDSGSAEIMYDLTYDVPSVEIDHLTRRGYLGGMEVGDEIFVPGTNVSIVRTKNSKSKKGKKPFGRGYRR